MPAASGSIWEHLGTSGSIWEHLGASGSPYAPLWIYSDLPDNLVLRSPVQPCTVMLGNMEFRGQRSAKP